MINVDYQDGTGIKQMDESLLRKNEGTDYINGHTMMWTEYWDDDKLVHRSVHGIMCTHPVTEVQ